MVVVVLLPLVVVGVGVVIVMEAAFPFAVHVVDFFVLYSLDSARFSDYLSISLP